MLLKLCNNDIIKCFTVSLGRPIPHEEQPPSQGFQEYPSNDYWGPGGVHMHFQCVGGCGTEAEISESILNHQDHFQV